MILPHFNTMPHYKKCKNSFWKIVPRMIDWGAMQTFALILVEKMLRFNTLLMII